MHTLYAPYQVSQTLMPSA